MRKDLATPWKAAPSVLAILAGSSRLQASFE